MGHNTIEVREAKCGGAEKFLAAIFVTFSKPFLGTAANTDTTSVQPFLQLLTMWCKDFYEDDFEHDSGLRYSMG